MKNLIIKTLIAVSVLLPAYAPAHPDEIVLELQSSTDLSNWEAVDVDALSVRDGKLRLNESFDGKGWFRLKIASGHDVARAKLMDFRDAGGPPLIPDDYADMKLDGVDPGNIGRVNDAVFQADQSVIESPALFQDLIFEIQMRRQTPMTEVC